MKVIYSILYILIIVVMSMFGCTGCNTVELKKSKIEDQTKSINLAAWSNCIRASGKSDTRSGFNVRDCDKLVDSHLKENEYNICVTAMNDKSACWSFYYDKAGKLITVISNKKVNSKPKIK